MRLLSLVVRIALFLVVLVFALANTQPVAVTLVPGVPGLMFEAPLVLWLLAVFTLGALMAVIFMLPTLIRKKRAVKAEPKPFAHHGRGDARADQHSDGHVGA